jgi:protein TonB
VAPTEIVPEPEAMPVATGSGIDDGVEAMLGGVEGGVEGGLAGGIVGGIGRHAPPPPVPAPIRVGGQISPPALVRRVEPNYPAIAQVASVEGVVILEATVDERGRVRDVKVLRSHPLLAKAAVDAVREWQYEPLMLNGTAQPFVLTVTVSFRMG